MELAKRRNRNNFNDTTHNLCHEAEVSPFLHSFLLLCRIFLFRGAIPNHRVWLAHRVSLISLLSKLLYNCSLVSHASTHWGVIALLASPRLHLATVASFIQPHQTKICRSEYLQGSAKKWTLDCVIPASWPPLAAGARFTQPRALSLSDPCTPDNTHAIFAGKKYFPVESAVCRRACNAAFTNLVVAFVAFFALLNINRAWE